MAIRNEDLVYKLIGEVGAKVVIKQLSSGDDSFFLAKLDKLASEELDAIVLRLIELKDNTKQGKEPNLGTLNGLNIKISNDVASSNIPREYITNLNGASIRNLDHNNIPTLTAINSKNIEDTMDQVSSITSDDIKNEDESLWIETLNTCLEKNQLEEQDSAILSKALQGLKAAMNDQLSLYDYASYIIATVTCYIKDYSIYQSLGIALSSLKLPRRKEQFPKKKYEKAKKITWKLGYKEMLNYECFYTKQDTSGNLIDKDQLIEAFNRNKDLGYYDENACNIINNYINSSNFDYSASQALFELDWDIDNVSSLFTTRKKSVKLGKRTEDFITKESDAGFADELTNDEADLLESMDNSKKTKGNFKKDKDVYTSQLKDFFEERKDILIRNAALYSKWEKLVYDKEIECENLYNGLIEAIVNGVCNYGDSRNRIKLKINTTATAYWWKTKANTYFAYTISLLYRSLFSELKDYIELTYPKSINTKALPIQDYTAYRLETNVQDVNSKDNKEATIFKFNVIVYEEGVKSLYNPSYNVILNADLNKIGYKLDRDLKKLLDCYNKNDEFCYILQLSANRNSIGKQNGFQEISLENISSIQGNKESGVFVYKNKTQDLKNELKKILEKLPNDISSKIKALLVTFNEDYHKAIKDFLTIGICYDSFLKQAQSYGELLKYLTSIDLAESNLKLLYYILNIGVINTLDKDIAIVAAYHPEKLKFMALKQKYFVNFVKHLLDKKTNIVDKDLYIDLMIKAFNNNYGPELLTSIDKDLLLCCSTCNNYSLYKKITDDTDIKDYFVETNATNAANDIFMFIKEYLALYPHLADSLNILLYECYIPDLVLKLIKKLASSELIQDSVINLYIANDSSLFSKNLYRDIINKLDEDTMSLIVSSLSDSFKSNLRLFLLDELDTSKNKFDICVLYDVFSKFAKIDYIYDKDINTVIEDSEFELNTKNRKYNNSLNDLSSSIFLISPSQTNTAFTYLKAINKYRTQSSSNLLFPIKKLTVEGSVVDIIDNAHKISDLVVTFDDFLEKKNLIDRGIKIIKFKRSRVSYKNEIISSIADTSRLLTIIKNFIKELIVDDSSKVDVFADKIVKDALSISGNIVMKATKSYVFTYEMFGLVLCKQILIDKIASYYGSSHVTGFYMIDDYSKWFISKNNYLADILALSVHKNNQDQIVLDIRVIESKYISSSEYTHSKKSSAQLINNLLLLENSLIKSKGNVEYDLWKDRLVNLIEEITYNNKQQEELVLSAKKAIVQDQFILNLSGASFVFNIDKDTANNDIEYHTISDKAYQIIIKRNNVQSLIYKYICNESLLSVFDSYYFDDVLICTSSNEQIEFNNIVDNKANISNINDTSKVLDVEKKNSEPEQKINFNETKLKQSLNNNCSQDLDNNYFLTNNMLNLMKMINYKASLYSNETSDKKEWSNNVAKKLQRALKSYDLEARIESIRSTPNGASIAFFGSDRLTVEKIRAKEKQLLTTHAIEVTSITPRPGKIIINVKSDNRDIVRAWTLWSSREFNYDKTGVNLAFVIGIDEFENKLLYLNLGNNFQGARTADPHTLLVGATGSGKSVALRALLLDIAMTNNPNDVKFILIDPKMGVELNVFNRLPHMIEPTIIDKERATSILNYLVEEMDRRYTLLAEKHVAKISSYNEICSKKDRLPYIFFVHDEFTEWMLDENYKNQVANIISRLAVKARAAGIHFIFASQRPEHNIFPSQIRDNVGNRLVFKVKSSAAAEIASGMKNTGAEKLLGQGHMMALLSGEIIMAQAPLISEDEANEVINIINDNY